MSTDKVDLPHDRSHVEASPSHQKYASSSTLADDQAETSSLPPLPEIPAPDLDLSLSLESIIGQSFPTSDKVSKRASNVLKLSEENEKLKQELRAMSERLEAAERRRVELDRRAREKKAAAAAAAAATTTTAATTGSNATAATS
ncbi:hypothetical protein HETIRDRAFT_448940 [Heterobasidion irregulare TC 32-1]|uniref:Uncharacterized protein n=1 Tax=Heterobasidion irregulare (strain TC 32-1) TaxID=747525 RepID=W4KJI2_HETIT|nr:uncharacterized protein HETIRDRAFT_448940 [Heterobasidion irregulare TC 32-1]ETW86018.1 hypothetical protein HETIRDRAFT_448940 [Heterobasidion irregulare TC 32-1]